MKLAYTQRAIDALTAAGFTEEAGSLPAGTPTPQTGDRLQFATAHGRVILHVTRRTYHLSGNAFHLTLDVDMAPD